jgi:UDP-N-acetylmuramate dehydrogenase
VYDVDFDRLADTIGGVRRASLAELTTYRVGGRAEVLVRIESLDRLRQVARVLSELDVPVLVVGRGSNMLVADRGFGGVAIQLGDFAAHCTIEERGDEAIVRAGGLALLPVVARRTAGAGWTGLEWAVGVPGSVGGAVRMNAGGHGSDMAASLVDVDMVDLRDGSEFVRSAVDLGLRFRGSDVNDREIVTEARLRVTRGEVDSCRSTIDEIVRWRREHQPGGQNAGSVFVNPIPGELSAGELIDRAGLRGRRLGSAEVSTKHANFIQADVDGTAADVKALMDLVRRRVVDEFGIELRSEIRLVGFDDTNDDPSEGVS